MTLMPVHACKDPREEILSRFWEVTRPSWWTFGDWSSRDIDKANQADLDCIIDTIFDDQLAALVRLHWQHKHRLSCHVADQVFG